MYTDHTDPQVEINFTIENQVDSSEREKNQNMGIYGTWRSPPC